MADISSWQYQQIVTAQRVSEVQHVESANANLMIANSGRLPWDKADDSRGVAALAIVRRQPQFLYAGCSWDKLL